MNLLKRILTAVVAIPLLLYIPFWGLLYFSLFIFMIAFLGASELQNMLRNKKIELSYAKYFAGFLPLITYHFYLSSALYGLVFFLIILFLIELFGKKKEAHSLNLGSAAMILIYTGIFPSFLIEILRIVKDPKIIILIYTVIWVTDTFAYFGGMSYSKFFKNHKLYPRVSPNKSIEGAISGLLFGFASGIVFQQLFPLAGFSLNEIIILSLGISLFGQIGDLVESLIKRDCEVKDSSNLIPGHGGILDRFDSLFFVSPLVGLFIIYITYS